MSDFRTKILGLAAMGMAFSGLAFGQAYTAASCAANITATNNPTLRAEGETELVADAIWTGCTTTGLPTSAVLYAALSLPVTSKAITGNQFSALPAPTAPATTVPYQGNSDAVLIVQTAADAAQYVAGTVSGTSVSFSLPCTNNTAGLVTSNCLQVGATTFTVTNIRVNASGAANPQVTETLLLQIALAPGNGTVNVSTAGGIGGNVGYILPSLSYSLPATSPLTPVFFTICSGNTIPAGGTVAPTANTTVTIKELVAGAFKLVSGVGSEAGSFPNTANPPSAAYNVALSAATTPYLTNGIGTATQATQVTVGLANIPASATVYAPQTITSASGNGFSLTLSGSPTPVTAPAGLVGLNGGVVAFTPTNGTVSITYTPTATGTGTTFAVPLYIIFAGNTAAVQGPITAAVYYTPAAAVSGPASLIPTFAVSTAAASNLQSIVACNTTLMFPYVTNATGFETGIAIANTTTDNLGTIPGKPSSATPVNGTCTLNFYGNAAQPTATVTPTLGAYSSTAPTVVPIYANILTTMIGSSGFSGYAIASCNFQDAHGFAFITDTTGTFSGTEGYLAIVVPSGRGENSTIGTVSTGE
jgi:hypothetical protein